MRLDPRVLILAFLVFIPSYKASAGPETFVLAPGISAELDDPAQAGPLPVLHYSDNLQAEGYYSATVFHPIGRGPFPATSLTAGFTNSKEDILWLGKHLASHGIIALVFTPTTSYIADARIWAKGHLAAIDILKQENLRLGSPLFGLLDEESLGLTGYSLGGAGSILAANQLGTQIKSVVPLNAYLPTVPTTDAPYLFVVGNQDTVATASRVQRTFLAMNGESARAFANIDGLNHYGTLTDRAHKHPEIARMATAWMKVFLAKDVRYMTFINGPEMDAWIEEGEVFATAADYIFSPSGSAP